MGLTLSCGKETDIPEPRVEAFMRWGNRLESTNNLIAAIKAYKKAKEICHNRLVIDKIDLKIQEYKRAMERQQQQQQEEEQQNTTAQKQKEARSSILTKGFREHFLKFQSLLKKLEFHQANNEIDLILNTTNFPTIKSLGTYFQTTMHGIVCSTDQFRMYDTEQEYHLKDNILLLVRNLAFVSFTRNKDLGIKMDNDAMNKMSNAIISHLKYFKKQESKTLSYTILLFHLSYIQDILEIMATTESFADKIKVQSAAKDVAMDCISLNFSGALKHVMNATGQGILIIAKERIKGKLALTTIDYLIKYKAVANLAKEYENNYKTSASSSSSRRRSSNSSSNNSSKNVININKNKQNGREERKSSTNSVDSSYSNLSTLESIDDIDQLKGIDNNNNNNNDEEDEKGESNNRKESKTNLPSVTENEAMVLDDIDSISKKNNNTTAANDDIYFNSFCDLLNNAYDNQLNWKIYIQLLHDLHELILATNDVRKQIRLIKGVPDKNLVGLQHFSTFGKLSYIFNFFEDYNCRIREQTLLIAIDLWKKCDELKEHIQPIFLARNEVIKSEHTLIRNILNNDLTALAIITYEIKDKQVEERIQECVADLVHGYCQHKVKELANLVVEHKSNEKNFKLKNIVDRVKSDLLNLANHTNESKNQLIRSNSSRIRGDKSKAMMLYRESLFHYNNWSQAIVTLSKSTGSFTAKHNINLARCNVTMGDSYLKDGEYVKALECFTKALPELTKALGTYHNEVAEIYNNIGDVFVKQGKLDEALENYKKTLTIRLSKDMFTNVGDIASIYNDIAHVYVAKGDQVEKALENYNNAINVQIKTIGENHLNIARAYHNIAHVHRQNDAPKKALEYFLKEVSILKDNLGKENPRLASIYNLIGTIYHEELDDFDNGLKYLLMDLKISLNVFGEDHPSIVKLYNAIGEIYKDKQLYNKSLEFYNKSLEIQLDLVGNDHIDVAFLYYNIGECYVKQGNYVEALKYLLDKALNIQLQKRHSNMDQLNVAFTYFYIGICYHKQKSYDVALEYHEKAIQIRQKASVLQNIKQQHNNNSKQEDESNTRQSVVDLNHEAQLDLADSSYHIGIAYLKLGHYEKAFYAHNFALNIRIAELNDDYHELIGASHKQLGIVCEFQRKFHNALEHYKKDLEIQIHNFDLKHLKVAISYMNIATVYYQQQNYDSALDSFHKGLEIRLENLGEQHVKVGDVYNNIAGVYYNKGLQLINLGVALDDESENEPSDDDDDDVRLVEMEEEALNINNNKEKSINKKKKKKEEDGNDNNEDECDKSRKKKKQLSPVMINYNTAIEYYNKCLQIRIEKYGEKHLNTAILFNNIAIVYEARRDFDHANENYVKALEIYKVERGENSFDVAIIYNNIGNLYRIIMCKPNKAMSYYKKSLVIFTDLLGEADGHTKHTQSNINLCLSQIRPRHRVMLKKMSENKIKLRTVKSMVFKPFINTFKNIGGGGGGNNKRSSPE